MGFEKEIEDRIGKGRKVTGILNSILWSKDILNDKKPSYILLNFCKYNAAFEVWQIK